MRKIIFLFCFLFLSFNLVSGKDLTLTTTTSLQDSGLLDYLIPKFEAKFNYKVKVIAVGSGEALELGKKGVADIILAHAPKKEKEFMEEGFGINRETFLYNSFVLLGPSDDPAKILGIRKISLAFLKIFQNKVNFISRSDNSGTDFKEKEIWKELKIAPRGEWYIETGQGMGESLLIAFQKKAYILSDRATYLVFKDKLNLKILLAYDPILANPYSIILVNTKKFPKADFKGANLLKEFLLSKEIQKEILNFGKEKFKENLFYPASF
ncbi:MAG: substrate-binding domain-containing protein [Armatimonadetes bacterium]|nr:substrate-binding domain-containing protein [Armatimonadota bacterium]